MNVRYLLPFSLLSLALSLCLSVPAWAVSHNPVPQSGSPLSTDVTLGEVSGVIDGEGKVHMSVAVSGGSHSELLGVGSPLPYILVYKTSDNTELARLEISAEGTYDDDDGDALTFDALNCGCAVSVKVAGLSNSGATEPKNVTLTSSEVSGSEGGGISDSSDGGAGGVKMDTSLGGSTKGDGAAFGKGAGKLSFSTDKPSADTYSPKNLKLLGAEAGVERVTAAVGSDTVLRQLVSATQVTDIVPGDGFEGYTIKKYPLSAKSSTKVDGVYLLSGSPQSSIKIENTGAVGTYDGLRITTKDGSAPAKESAYAWTTDSATGRINEISLSNPDSLKKESRKVDWSTDGQSYDETRTIRSSSDVLVSKTVSTYTKSRFGYVLVKQKDFFSETAAPLETTWAYYEGSEVPSDPLTPEVGKLKWRKDPSGYWETYEYDANGALAKTVSQYLDSAFEDEENSKVQTVTYSLTNPLETHVTKIKAQEVARSYLAEFDSADENERRTITCRTVGASWTDSSNLMSATRTYKSSHAIALKRGQTKWTRSPDGTMTVFTYAKVDDTKVTTTDRGAPDTAFPATDTAATDSFSITDGLRTVSTHNRYGQQIKEETRYIASSSAALVLSEWEALEVDDLGRPLEIGYGDGTTRNITYIGSSASCGSCSGAGNFLVESETDRNGVLTEYLYDSLNRRVETKRLGLKEQVAYDAADRVLETHRIGSDNSDIRLSKTVYDLAGRVVETYDALNNKTAFAYSYPSGGGLLTTTTYPATAAGSGTRIAATYSDGSTKEIFGTAVSPLKYAYGTWAASGQAGQWTQEIKIGDASSESEWGKTYSDLSGRTVKQEYPASSSAVASAMAYNALGQLVKQTDSDGVQTLFTYNTKGERELAVVDMDRDGAIDYEGTPPLFLGDRITKSVRDVYSRSGTVVSRVATQVWAGSADTPTTVSVVEQDGYGNASWQTDAAGATGSTVLARTGAGAWTVAAVSPDGVQRVQTYVGGRLSSVVIKPKDTSDDLEANENLQKTVYAYDAHGRVITQNVVRFDHDDDIERLVPTTYTYTARDEVLTVDANNGTETTTYSYDALGSQLTITRPDLSVTTNEYYLRNNQLKKASGSQTYPVEYTYDLHGRMKTLTTWQNATTSAGAAVTKWNYDAQRGWLTQKLYDDNTGPSYTYTNAGRPLTRTWARTVSSAALVTTYAYNNAGDLSSTNYSDTTPDVTITYNRFGAQQKVTDATGERTFTYDPDTLRPHQEQLPSFYGDRILTRSYQATGSGQVPGRNDGFELGVSGDLDQDYDVVYGYDTSGRLGTVTDANGTFTYGYLANSNLRHTVTGPVHVATTNYESYRDVIDTVENKVGSTTVSKFDYTVNNLGQRTQRANTGTAFGTASTDVFAYNSRGEVESATNATLTARNQSFVFDDIGNRKTFTQNAGTTGYTANSLNQYTVIAGFEPSYDLDGNQRTTSSGQVYEWDAENRLISVEPVLPASGDKKQLNVYDAQSRRVRKQVSTYASGSWSLTTDEKFIYDGWNLVAVLDAASSNGLLRTYTWGADLSGSMQGAGGVGGLLSAKDGGSIYHYTYDANGNVSEVLNSSGGIAAHYEYDAFGNTALSSGIYAASNAYRYSTKPLDDVSELYYYGLRYCNPSTGRWLSRDPIEEQGGVNLYGMVGNNLINVVDLYGLAPCITNLFFGHGDVGGVQSQQTRQRDTDLRTIRSNNERHDYSVRGGNPNHINDNCSMRWGYGGCQAPVANSALPAQNRGYDPSVLRPFENAAGDVPFANITQAIDAMLSSAFMTARNDCSAARPPAGRCPCSEVIINLRCATQGTGGSGRFESVSIGGEVVLNTSIENVERVARRQSGQRPACGGQWRIDCRNPQAEPQRIR